MAYLKRYRIDRLKIDRSFVRSLTGEPATREIVRSIVTLGHALGMAVTAAAVIIVNRRPRARSPGSTW